MIMVFCVRKVALSVSFLWLLMFVVSFSFWTRDIIITVPSTKSLTFLKDSGIHHNLNLNLNLVSKRRVPNGPDPIHNRRVGTTRLPPT